MEAIRKLLVGHFHVGAVVDGSEAFRALKGKRILNERILIRDCGDIHPFHDGPIFDAQHVRVEDTDKNWVYYWLNTRRFPNAKRVELLAHPCEPCVMWHWGKSGVDLVLDENWRNYKRRWAAEYKNISVGKLRDQDNGVSYTEPLRIEPQLK